MEEVQDSLRNGLYWCVAFSVILVPVGFASGLWVWVTVAYALIIVVSVVVGVVLAVGGPVLAGAAFLLWLLALGVGAGLVVFGLHAIVTFEGGGKRTSARPSPRPGRGPSQEPGQPLPTGAAALPQ
ncbi:hypothetical protein AB0O67_19105 [Streptomyces sp. NPDC086077]|uniref:hypothetical protein n=1 Tax=Streptomyces sp. NPDC086077 TaxID=3154862 RepID=UPI003436DB28